MSFGGAGLGCRYLRVGKFIQQALSTEPPPPPWIWNNRSNMSLSNKMDDPRISKFCYLNGARILFLCPRLNFNPPPPHKIRKFDWPKFNTVAALLMASELVSEPWWQPKATGSLTYIRSVWRMNASPFGLPLSRQEGCRNGVFRHNGDITTQKGLKPSSNSRK